MKYSEYPSRARRLADTGTSLLETMTDPTMDRAIVISELEAATSSIPPSDLRTRFEPALAAKPAMPSQSPEDVLSGILLELQSANALMAAGLAMNEHGRGADPKFLNDTVAQIQATSSDVGLQIAKSTALGFAPQTEPSANQVDALKLFRESADRTLQSIDSGTKRVIGSAFEKLKEVDKSKVSEAIDNLGKSFEVVATAGRLIRQGLEKLKAVLDTISSLFGSEALADLKDKVRDTWQKFTGDQDLVSKVIGVPVAQRRVSTFSALPGLELSKLDVLSLNLALLEDSYQGKRKILDGLVSAVVIAMGIVAALQFFGLWAAAPWVALAAGGAYAGIIGGALLVGMNYTGSRPLFAWTRGVCEIVPDPSLKT